MDQGKSERDANESEPAATPPARKPWETPMMEELAVQLSANRPFTGPDGDFFPDCTRS
jgi:hypothetical protein